MAALSAAVAGRLFLLHVVHHGCTVRHGPVTMIALFAMVASPPRPAPGRSKPQRTSALFAFWTVARRGAAGVHPMLPQLLPRRPPWPPQQLPIAGRRPELALSGRVRDGHEHHAR